MHTRTFIAGTALGIAIGAILPLAAQGIGQVLTAGVHGIANGTRIIIACTEAPSSGSLVRSPLTEVGVAYGGPNWSYGIPVRCE